LHPTLKQTADRVRKWRFLRGFAALVMAMAAAALLLFLWTARPNPQRVWEEAQSALKSGDFATTKAKLALIARQREPTNLDWSLRAQLAIASDQPDEALASLAHIPKGDPLAPQAFLLAGRIERQRNRVPAAEALFRKALVCDPGLIGAHKELIYILHLQLRRREVDAQFKALSRFTALSHHELLTWALSHFSAWVLDSAPQLEAFIRGDPQDRFSRLSLATVYLNTSGTESRVEETLKPLPRSDPLAETLRAELLLKNGRVDDAAKLLANARGDDPQLARIRGRVAFMHQDFKAAVRHYQEVVTKEPYDRVSLSELGRSLLQTRDKSDAESYMTRARYLDELYNLTNGVRRSDQENQPSDLTQFGRTCEAAGLLEEALGWYKLAIYRDPLNTEAQAAVRRLGAATGPPSARLPPL
jgi:tetratricopeptide (TPR) repeat protein